MPANKFRIGAICALVIAATFVALVQHTAQSRLRGENLLLQRRFNELTPLVAGKGPPSNTFARMPGSPASSANQLAELEHLRVAVAAQKREIQKLRTELAAFTAVASIPTMPSSLRFVNIPKAAWVFAGYDTPEAAPQSMLWATREGDLNALRASLTLGEQQRRGWNSKTDDKIVEEGIRGLNKATGFQILKTEMLSGGDAHFTVYIDGLDPSDQPMWMDMKKIGEEWKSDASEHHRQ
jgi:hypothetical protein